MVGFRNTTSGTTRSSGGNNSTNTGAGIHHDITLTLSQLQNLCKRDPIGHLEEYEAQIRRLESELNILLLQHNNNTNTTNTDSTNTTITTTTTTTGGSSHVTNLTELIQFAAAVSSSSYKGKESDRIANLFMNVLVGGGTMYMNHYYNNNNNNKDGKKAHSNKKTASSTTSSSSVAQIISIPTSAYQLHRDIRKSIVSALILMRNKGCIEPLLLLELFFRIMVVIPDKTLREILYRHIVNDIRNINKKGKRDEIINKSIQSFLHKIVTTHGNNTVGINDNDHTTTSSSSNTNNNTAMATEIAGKRAVDMVCELYRRRVWTDERTIAIIASAVESNNHTIMKRAIRFFLNIEEKMANDDTMKQEQDCNVHNTQVDYHLYSKKTAARQRETKRQLKAKKKAQEKKQQLASGEDSWIELTSPDSDKGTYASKKLYPAIELLRDPYGLAEFTFQRLKKTTSFKYETKILLINFITRLVGNHELLLLPLYSFLQKYMLGHQRDVTAILAYTVQACHEYVPPDEVYGILKTIASNFITERCTEEQMAVGINAVRAICSRVPSVMNIEESKQTMSSISSLSSEINSNDMPTSTVVMDIEAFTRDLASYAKHRDRSVSIAGKSWMNFVREVNPGLLQGKDRGLHGTALHKSGIQPTRYGEHKIATGVEGADLLIEYEMKKKKKQQQQLEEEEQHPLAGSSNKKNHNKTGGDGYDEYEDDCSDSEDEQLPLNDAFHDNDSDVELDEQDHDEEDDEEDDEEEEVSDDDEGSGEWQDMDEDEVNIDDDEEAPQLVLLGGKTKEGSNIIHKYESIEIPDISKMSAAERDKIKQQVSSTRIFTSSEFAKMRKLVEREKKAIRDPRERARRKRAIARGEEFEALSDDDSSDDSDDDHHLNINIQGAVNASDIMALSTKKRQSKAERLEKILAGRTAFEAKGRNPSGSTNTEKQRKKNFLMSKFSSAARSKGRGKGHRQKKRKDLPMSGMRDAKKRRRKL